MQTHLLQGGIMRSLSTTLHRLGALVPIAAMAACADAPVAPGKADGSDPISEARGDDSRVRCDPDNAGITLPPGFCAVVVADLVVDGRPAAARHLAVTPAGDIFVAINSPRNNQPSNGIIALRDANGDGRADEERRFSPGLGGSGIAWDRGLLFFGANDRVMRYQL